MHWDNRASIHNKKNNKFKFIFMKENNLYLNFKFQTEFIISLLKIVNWCLRNHLKLLAGINQSLQSMLFKSLQWRTLVEDNELENVYPEIVLFTSNSASHHRKRMSLHQYQKVWRWAWLGCRHCCCCSCCRACSHSCSCSLSPVEWNEIEIIK